MPLGADDSFFKFLSQFIFVGLMIAAWALRKAVERKDRRAPPPTPSQSVEPTQSQAREQHDVSYGTRALAHPPRRAGVFEDRTRALEAGVGGQPPPIRARPGPKSAAMPAGADSFGAQGPRLKTANDAAYAIGMDRTSDRRRHAALARLGIPSGPDALRTHTRMAMRWMEVLGPPRALRGPHRPTTFDRAGRRR